MQQFGSGNEFCYWIKCSRNYLFFSIFYLSIWNFEIRISLYKAVKCIDYLILSNTLFVIINKIISYAYLEVPFKLKDD